MPYRNASLPPLSPDDAAATVHIVDDDASFLTALGRRLTKAGYDVVTYPGGQQLLSDLPEASQLGCILMDARMPGMSGPELQSRLIECGSTLPIVFISGYPDIPITVSTMKAGAEDFLIKPIHSELLLRAVERAIAHHKTSRKLKANRDVVRVRLSKLTPRERQVFELVVRGKINKQIAHQLGAAERTIKAHRQRVMEKMAVQSLPELVSSAEQLGVLGENEFGREGSVDRQAAG